MSSRPPWVSSSGHAERQALGRRGGGVALGHARRACRRGSGARRRRESASSEASRRSTTPACATTPRACATRGSPRASRARREVAAGRVPDRDHAPEVEQPAGARRISARWSTAARRPRASAGSRRRSAPTRRYSTFQAAQPRAPGRRRAPASACGRTAPSRSRRAPGRRRGRARRRPAGTARRTASAPGRRVPLRQRDTERARRFGQPGDALVDLLGRHARVGEAQRVLARPRAGSPCP